ncbi:MAG: hypothetical protein JW918_05100 [Anaerolineae bacterium]|nr:hypothetical protein [Anaerolineae bacterium]
MLEPYSNPYLMIKMERIHRQELLKEAEHYRLVRQVGAGTPSLFDRILASIGSLLIAAGERLRSRHVPRHVPVVRQPSEAYCVDC